MAPTAYLKTGGTRHVCTVGNQRIAYKNPTLPGLFDYRDGNQNGSIVVSVLNALTSSSPSTGIYIVAGINCGGIEFANPREIEMPMSNYALQGHEMASEANEQTVADVNTVINHHNEIYTGEIARSFRQLLHRTNLYTRYTTFGGGQVPNATFSDKIPTVRVEVTAASSVPPDMEAYGSSFLTPALPLMPGALYDHGTSNSSLNNGMVKNGTTVFAANDQVCGTNIGIPTITAYLASSYVGWRGSHVYSARVSKPDYGGASVNPALIVTDFSISRFFRCISRLFDPNQVLSYRCNMRTAFTWRIFRASSVTSTNADVANMQFFNNSKMSTGFSSNGSGGFAVTNPSVVNVVDAVVPYYNQYRMLPCNPCCNLFCNYDWNSISWNVFDENVENVLNPMVAINTTVNAIDSVNNSIALLSHHPIVDVYH
jgi:hypothetical protein